MPGDPVQALLSRTQFQDPEGRPPIYDNYMRRSASTAALEAVPYFWVALLHGDLGRASAFPAAGDVVIMAALPVHARAC